MLVVRSVTVAPSIGNSFAGSSCCPFRFSSNQTKSCAPFNSAMGDGFVGGGVVVVVGGEVATLDAELERD